MQIRSVLFLPVGAVLISAVAILYPGWLADCGRAIVPLLGLVMFAMGMTLKPADFKRVLEQPLLVFIGVTLQYIFMPLIAWFLSSVLNLPVLLATGMILVGSCPGGTASNVICFLAKANVALSISLTAVSTLLAVVLTPLITLFYVDQSVAVPVSNMMKNLFFIVVLPVLSGVLINTYLQNRIDKIKSFLPIISVVSIIFIIGVIVAKNSEQLFELGGLLFCAVALHNLFGLIAGYSIPKLMGYDKTVCRTLSIEVGMQNSGLAVVLANQFFSAVAALPGALFSVWHNVAGSMLAALWSKSDN
ncbi:MAG: bile acid:sodium symporter family protein [Proteobacteria bacterium]|nr:bile acid:sodium symporter family protein [Pseudomonadota bacterium]NOG59194.1 bile acid:sodium symporter family protein [Pseudomonadota bacterium]